MMKKGPDIGWYHGAFALFAADVHHRNMILKNFKYLLLLPIVMSASIALAKCDDLTIAAQMEDEKHNQYADLFLMSFLADWGQRSFQAYTEEKPEIAIWALKNFAEILQRQYDRVDETNDSKRSSCMDLMLAHTRIALTYKKIKNQEMFEKHISIAINLYHETSKASQEKLFTKIELIDFVKRVDALSAEYKKKNELK